MATIDHLLKTLIPLHLDPVPKKRTMVNWLDTAGVPKLKANPSAKRGGGFVYYSVSHVEKLLTRGTAR
jgi:hypothetical protein